jgi:hypothetical protein
VRRQIRRTPQCKREEQGQDQPDGNGAAED